MSERETKTKLLNHHCPKCDHSPVFLVECQHYDDYYGQWEIEGDYKECQKCGYFWGGNSYLHLNPADCL